MLKGWIVAEFWTASRDIRIFPGGSSDGRTVVTSRCQYCGTVEVQCVACGKVFVFRGHDVSRHWRNHVCTVV